MSNFEAFSTLSKTVWKTAQAQMLMRSMPVFRQKFAISSSLIQVMMTLLLGSSLSMAYLNETRPDYTYVVTFQETAICGYVILMY